MSKITIFLLLPAVLAQNNLLNQIRSCGFGREELSTVNICLRRTIELVRNDIASGRSTLGLPLTDPIRIPHFEFSQREGPINIETVFRDISASGHSRSSLTKIEAGRSPPTLTLGLNIPHLQISGLYTASGNVLLLPIQGDGEFYSDMYNINGVMVSTLGLGFDSSGNQIIKPRDTKVTLSIDKIQSELTNLFDGDPVLSESMHHFLNTNDQFLLETLQPRISGILSNVTERLLGSALANIPVNSINPDLSNVLQRNSI